MHGCGDWGHALLVARWLGNAMRLGAGQTQEYFDQEAEGLTGPLLHAAALSGDLTIVDVYRWVLKREQDTPKKLPRTAGADDAIERLENVYVYAYTERQRDGIIGTAAVTAMWHSGLTLRQLHQSSTPAQHELAIVTGEFAWIVIVHPTG